MKAVYLIFAIIVFNCVSASAMKVRVDTIPQFGMEMPSPLNTFIRYTVNKCDSLSLNPNNYPFAISVYEDKDGFVYVSICIPVVPQLFYGSYFGFIEFSGYKFFMDESSEQLLREYCATLRQLDNYTTVEIEDYPVEDGIGPSWSFAIKDGICYYAGFHDGVW